MHPEVVQDGPGTLSDLRDGARADGAVARRGTEPRADRHAATAAGVRAADAAALRRVDGGRCCRRVAQLALATPVVLWGGWPFFVRGAASLRTRRFNMFTLIALGTGAAYRVERRRDARAGALPRVVPRPRRRGAGLLRGRRGDRHAGAARSGAGAARAARSGAAIRALLALAPRTARRAARRRQRGGRRARVACSPAIGCACGPARRSRWTASCSKGARRSTSRCSPASRFPSRRIPAIA